MLHYSIDNEVMTDLYRDFRQVKNGDIAQIRKLGASYMVLLEQYELDEKTINAIQGLAEVETQEKLEELETKIVHGYLTAKADLRKEETEYKAFVDLFDGEEHQALSGLWEYVVGQKVIPYKIKNRNLHVDVLSTPAMSLELDFEDVLIEDGRHPREILFLHIAGEAFEDEEIIRQEDGSEKKYTVKKYRLQFINGLSDGPYQVKESSFVFRGLKGGLHLYNYDACQGTLDVNADRLPWRILMHPLQAVLEKAQILGIGSLDKDELDALPLLCVFFELIQFYLDASTEAGIGRSLIHFDEKAAENFAFSQSDLDSASAYLAQFGLDELREWLEKANTERFAFCRYWIQFASMKKSEALYMILMDILKKCSSDYESRPMPLAYRKHRSTVRRALNEYFSRKKWRGEFPNYRKEKQAGFLEVSNVYKKMYTYINEKQKAYYVDFLESVSGQSYNVMAVVGYILLRDGESAREYKALNGYFLDGGRRSSHIVGQITIDDTMTNDQIIDALNSMIEGIESDTKF